ncbi:MAG TPA: phosphatase PAP2 family protein [Elusimicrobiota bacterium]|nr:phosphatase PAP2 family protein [Elusimicrobiota bacterium]
MSAVLAALGSADRWLLLKINRDWTAPALDAAMPVLTDLHKAHWFLFGAAPAMLAWWLWKGRRRALKVLIVAALAVGASDFTAHRVIKPWVARPRPERALGSEVVLRAPVGGAYGFPSNHASNMAAAASVLSVAYPAGTPVFAALAALVAYSRVYVGAHYPGDVLAGLALGTAIGWPWAALMLGGEEGRSRKKKRG